MAKEPFEEMRERMLKQVREGIRSAYESEEYALMQAINAYLETVKSYNLLHERLEEWYGIYYPEVKMGSQEMLAEMALVLNKKDTINKDAIKQVVKDERRSAEIFQKANSTMGRLMTDNEAATITRFAQLSKSMKETIDNLDGYIKKAATGTLPNITYLTDDKIAAELLSKAGSLDRLATMPASTIQLLGAEKALFKHLKFGSKPPKYGVLFKLSEVGGARKDLRGRIARVYANKISIAAKADAFSKRFIGKELKESLRKSISKMNLKEKRKSG